MPFGDITYESTNLVLGDAQLKLFRIQSPQASGWADTRPHTHRYYELHLMVKGSYVFEVEDREQRVVAGQAILFRPEMAHVPFCQGETAKEVVIALMVEQIPGEPGVYACFSEGLSAASGIPVSLSPDLMGDMLSFVRTGSRAGMRAYCYRKAEGLGIFVRLLDELGGFGSEATYVERLSDADFAIMLENYVENRSVTLAEMAEKLGYSKRHLSRLIKQNFGMTLRQIREGDSNRKTNDQEPQRIL